MKEPLGRTNEKFSLICHRLMMPHDAKEAEAMAGLARELRLPVDVSSSLGVWGHHLRGADLPFIGSVGADIAQAGDSASAGRMVQASLLALLSAIGKETLTLCFLPIKRALEEFQIAGALEALEQAREEGLIRYAGLQALGSPWAAQSVWQFHDAFEVVMIPRTAGGQAEKSLMPLAQARRVGVVFAQPLSLGTGSSMGHHPSVIESAEGGDPHLSLLASGASKGHVMVGVRSAGEMKASLDWQNHLALSESVYQAACAAAKEGHK